jgi:2-haloalkanoic acid dehalogenase type II
MPPRPSLITFDIFGTVLDWRSGLEAACHQAGRTLGQGEFDRIVDAQAALEHGPYLTYTTITRRSLADTLGLPDAQVTAISDSIGAWPLYNDAHLLRKLMQIAPCAAMTNSDRAHGEAIQAHLGFRLDTWLCAEDTRLYKPNPGFWRHMSRLRGIEPAPDWWHVSAYADYDLRVANELGLTTVFVDRPHARPDAATYRVAGLHGLVGLLS